MTFPKSNEKLKQGYGFKTLANLCKTQKHWETTEKYKQFLIELFKQIKYILTLQGQPNYQALKVRNGSVN